MRAIIPTLLIILLLAVGVTAQDKDVARLQEPSIVNTMGTQPASSPFSLLDFSRMHWSNSYSISFMSGSSGSGSVGLLNSTMFYELSSKLSMTLDIGIMHNAGVIWGDNNNSATFLPGIQLDYHPSEKFSMSIGVARYNYTFSPYMYPDYRYSYWHPNYWYR